MKLRQGQHLAYCTNIHRGENWPETFASLQQYTLAVRDKICPRAPFAIGLRLGERAAVELSDRDTLLEFHRWLEKNTCYIFTMNGFPYGQFHGTRVKEMVYRPDWTSPERVAYTDLLFNLLAELLPAGIEGSVSTLPGSFKEFHPSADALKAIRKTSGAPSSTSPASAKKPGARCTSASNPNRSACSKAAPRRCISSTISAPNIRATNGSPRISASTTTPAISPWNLRSRKTRSPAS